MSKKLAADDEKNNRVIDSAWEMVELLDALVDVDRASCSFCDEESWRGPEHSCMCPIGRAQRLLHHVKTGRNSR